MIPPPSSLSLEESLIWVRGVSHRETSTQTNLLLGYTNSSLYTGSIDYIDIPGTPSYWYIPLTCKRFANSYKKSAHYFNPAMTVQGNSISIDSGTTAAIDTGTTNIAGPASSIQAIYAQIPNSQPATGEWAGYYSFRKQTS
jgi:cathepsin D